MNRRVLTIVIVFAVLMVVTSALLFRVRTNYELGKAGIRLVDVPTLDERTNKISNVSAYLPEQVGEYVSHRAERITMAELYYLPPDTTYGRRIYTAPDNFQAMISIVLMGTDRTSIHKPQYCLRGNGQEIVGSELITVPIETPHRYDLEVMKMTLRSTQRLPNGETVPRSGLFMYWFVADGHLTPHHGERMWLMGKELLTTGRLQRWAYVGYFAVCTPGQEDALAARMKSFIADSLPEYQLTTGPEKRAVQGAGAGTEVQKLARK